jgi:Ca2+-binding EF-hand superfamily protein
MSQATFDRRILRMVLSLRLPLLAVAIVAVSADAGESPPPAQVASAFPYELWISGLERPIRVRFSVTVNGKPWLQNFKDIQRRYRQAMFAQLDADRDGMLSAEEARRIPPPRAWAALPGGDDVHVAFNFRILDANGDGAASADEFDRYAQAFGDVPVRVMTVAAGRATDDLFRALDANHDRVLTAAEWSAAANLMMKDRDANKVLTAEELRGPVSTVMPPEFLAAGPRNGSSRRSLEFEWKPAADAPADVEITIEYPDAADAPRRPLVGVRTAPGAAVLVSKLGLQGGAQVLSVGGRRLVLRVSPAAVRSGGGLRQQFLNEFAAVSEQSAQEVTLTSGLPPLLKSVFAIADRNDDGRLEAAELESYLDGLFAVESAADAARLRLIKFNERPGLMPLVDLNLDGRLSRRELTALPEQLAAVAGKAGRITRDDIPPTIVLVAQRGPFGESTEASVLENAGPPWFFRADRNQDGDLDREEFLGSPEDFDRLDANGDGWIDLDEAILGDWTAPPAETEGAK